MSKMPSVMTHNFSQVPQANIPRSVFNRSHGYKTTFNEGYLIPFYTDEVLPGDTFNLNATLFARLSTPIVPIMDNLFLDVQFFFVPNRLLWDNFQKFMGERDNPVEDYDDDTQYAVPTITSPVSTGWAVGSLSDYFGLPTGVPGLVVSALYHRAYNLIYNQWYRDQNLQDSVPFTKADSDLDSNYVLLKRGKRHDYFTSALPWPQKGPGVPLPVGDTAPIIGLGKVNQTYSAGPLSHYETDGVTPRAYANYRTIQASTADDQFSIEEDPLNPGFPNVRVDLSGATAATINELRQAFQIQRLYERDARGGSRYTEIVRSHFGVVSPDARLQRPEYLGGSSMPVNLIPIAQNSKTDATGTPQGNLAAIGTIAGHAGFTKSFTEHGVLIGLCSVRADLTYQQGIPKHFLRSTRFDYYWPSLAHLGEQAILNKELYAQGTGHETADNAVFGYQERYAEYRYLPSKITGQLRSTYASSLDVWHLSQEFSSLPTLSPTFIVEDAPMARVLAADAEAGVPHFIMDSYIKCVAARPMPVYSVPGLIDHF